jgi:DNA-binding NarL/FixJ family response regulator
VPDSASSALDGSRQRRPGQGSACETTQAELLPPLPPRMKVVAQTGDAEDLLRKGLAQRPDVAIVDVQMPAGGLDDGLRAGIELRRQQPDIAILVLSQLYEEQYALALISERAGGAGYLPRNAWGTWRSSSARWSAFAAGGTALDPDGVGRMLGRRGAEGPVGGLTPRERDVLGVMAEGKSNQASPSRCSSWRRRSRSTSRTSSTSSRSVRRRPGIGVCSPYWPTFASHESGRRSGADGGGCGASRLTAAASRRRACRRRRDSRD